MNIPITIQRIENIISNSSGLSIDDIRSKSRLAAFSNARNAIWFACHDIMGYSYPFIALLYDRDHTTIISGVNNIKKSGYSEKIRKIILENMKDISQKEYHQKMANIQTWS